MKLSNKNFLIYSLAIFFIFNCTANWFNPLEVLKNTTNNLYNFITPQKLLLIGALSPLLIKQDIKSALTTLGLSSAILWYQLYEKTKSTRITWDWASINTDDLQFPEGFLFGVATSAYQIEGENTGNVWEKWHSQGKIPELPGIACDGWNQYKQDVQLIKNLGANTYRFGIEWSRIEPEPGKFNHEALNHYEALCDELIANGISPMITIHHYNDPQWFADLGGFEKWENIAYYIRFAIKVIEHLHPKVDRWLTFNSPTSYAAKGYWADLMPPGKKDMQLQAEVLYNMLDAHVHLYQEVKKNPKLAQAQLGILHNIYQLDPAHWWNPLDHIGSAIGNHISHDCLYKFFTTGKFEFFVPGKTYFYHENTHAPKSLDFIGLNYYSHALMHGTKPQNNPAEMQTKSSNYTIYPEGFYRAIKELWTEVAQPLNIPIYITENGCSAISEHDRELHLRRYLYAMSKAIQEGCKVCGYCYWSLLDNYEWGICGEKNFGLYQVDFSSPQRTRTLKQSAHYFIKVAQRWIKPIWRTNNVKQ